MKSLNLTKEQNSKHIRSRLIKVSENALYSAVQTILP